MDVYKAIRTLYDEKKRLDRLIESLEALQARGEGPEIRKAPARRGRKRMSSEERQEVSDRMKKYWAARRQNSAPSTPAGSAMTAMAVDSRS